MAPKKAIKAKPEAAAVVGSKAPADEQPRKRGRKEPAGAAAAAPVAPANANKSTPGTLTEDAILAGTIPFVRRTSAKDFDPGKMIKVISWNVAGLRAVLKKSTELENLVKTEQPDILCLQETKLSDWEDCPKTGVLEGYEVFDSISVAKKGYAGTRTYVRTSSGLSATSFPGFAVPTPSSTPKHDPEGRIVTTTIQGPKGFALLNTYVPNAGMSLERLDYRVKEFDPMMRRFIDEVGSKMKLPVIWTGDLNVAERDYDRFFSSSFKQMQKSPGFTPEERASFRETLKKTDTVDVFRKLYPDASKIYSFWSARFNQRAKNNGWRLDYFVVSTALAARVVDCFMLPEYSASDHCPIALWLQK